MRKRILCSCLGILSAIFCQAQLMDNFSDGDFTANPAWVGGTADFIVNASNQLQSNNTVANASFYLSTPNTKATTAQWDFFCNITFNPSSTNYADVYLTTSASDLTLSSTSGYFVRIGGTDDEVSLFRKDASGTVTKIIDGVNGILNTSNSILKIRVIRNASNQWTLSRDLNNTGSFAEGSVTDATFLTSAFFGVLIKQSTASFFQRHFFDDFIIQDYVPDVIPPAIVSSTATSSSTLDILFNEPVETASSQLITNYTVNNGLGSPVSATRDLTNSALVHLVFTGSFPNRTTLQLTVNNVRDLAGNTLTGGTSNFSYFTAAQYDVVIDELMADPTPQVGLPNSEWIELRNTSGFDINLQGWRIGDPTGLSGPMPSYVLKADSFVIVCTSSAVSGLAAFGPVISVTSFPSLDNSSDILFLRSAANNLIHTVNYSDAWYQNDLKKDGGWTLEMIDTKNPCAGMNNWKASTDPKGGTPGKKNSVDAVNPDKTSPRLLRAFAVNATTIELTFDESLDSLKASSIAGYSISDGIGAPVSVTVASPLFSKVTLRLSSPLLANKVYTVTATGQTDCSGNAVAANNTARVGSVGSISKFDIVINEVLFNPKPNVTDYVELYNRSNKVLNLKNVYLANRNSSNAVSSIVQLTTEDRSFFPGDYIVASADPESVKANYIVQSMDAFITVSTPSYNDDAGNVIILNEQGAIVDELSYVDDWQFPLISNVEGVSLERINPDDTSLLSQDQQKNWHSAASSVGFGTPTYKNSQYRTDATVQGDITVSPAIISPDNDGFDDFATISYHFPEQGYVANITIFDAAGRTVRYLQKSALSGTSGYYRWDGLGDKNQKLPAGIYIIYSEVFNLTGKTKRFKNTIVLANRR